MWVRSPLSAPLRTSEHYFISVTAHGTTMAYVLTTVFIMGFGYYVAATSLDRRIPAATLAWLGFFMAAAGAVMAAVTVFLGRAPVLYTFYPPLVGSAFYYIGVLLVFAGSWIWCGIMIAMMTAWKRSNPGQPVPLAMFATVANAILWLWTTAGVAAELLFQVLPGALGWTETVNVGLSRTLFSWTLHAIVYFWLIPAYTAFYTMAPQAAGGRLFSDTMGRIAFVLLLLYSLPVGLHHLLMDPEQSTGFKFLQTVLTVLVTVPTLLTVFTITASFEIAGRLRGGRGLLGWLAALPWDRPMVLATGMSFFMLFFGGGGGIVNMSYSMNALVHNTSWVTAHFHLIAGGTTIIMYFAIAYAIWPRLTGRQAPSLALQRLQLWLWFIGMLIMTLPWHWLGLQGQWRRSAQFDYTNPIIAGWGPWVVVSLAGACLLLTSAFLFLFNLASFHWRGELVSFGPMRYALALNPPRHVPAALNGFGLWNVLVLVLMLFAYGYPIAQFFVLTPPQAIVHGIGGDH